LPRFSAATPRCFHAASIISLFIFIIGFFAAIFDFAAISIFHFIISFSRRHYFAITPLIFTPADAFSLSVSLLSFASDARCCLFSLLSLAIFAAISGRYAIFDTLSLMHSAFFCFQLVSADFAAIFAGFHSAFSLPIGQPPASPFDCF
jgi:hypothetical protein